MKAIALILPLFLAACDDGAKRAELERQHRVNDAILARLEQVETSRDDTPIPRLPPARGMADFADEWAAQDREDAAALEVERAAIEANLQQERRHRETMGELRRMRVEKRE
jgi:hypothetical protein